MSCAAVIDLTMYTLPVTELGQLYAAVLHECPELFHVAYRFSYTYCVRGDTSVVAEVYPAYTLTGDDLTVARAFYRDTVAGAVTELEAATAGHTRTEAEAVLFLHDWLADRYAYDTRAAGSATSDTPAAATPNADAFSLFRDGVGICQAYALAYIALCRAAGLEADLVSSAAMNHAWNHVRVDGVWYHVDVTRDDPIPAPGGHAIVNHTRLLRSDAGMRALGYHGFSCACAHACTDTRYERADGSGALEAFSTPLYPLPDAGDGDAIRWVGLAAHDVSSDSDRKEDTAGVPTTVVVRPDGITVGIRGDADGDGALTPGDLLRLYGTAVPEAWRAALRAVLLSTPSDLIAEAVISGD